ncbi:Ig-like domain-containing protein [Anaerofustis sp. HA2171]|uniref:Ig-like domain-containing protein n=1 Tax=Anaerofustis butyriciformans TaxID=3108533 RepID=UPI002E3752A1|nr:Ig-like domain-containing protein [Anaerofustis sp. HA2171]
MKRILSIFLTVMLVFSIIPPIYASNEESVNATNITFNKDELVLNGIGESFKLEAAIEPASYDKDLIYWNSTDKNIASVDADGVVVSSGVGTATIFAMTANGKKAECKVTVNEVKINGVNVIGPESIYMGGGDYYFIKYLPSNTTDRYVTLTSSNEDIVSYPKSFYSSNSFKLTAKKVGTTTITVNMGNGVSTSFEVSVKPVMASSLRLDYSTLNLFKDEEKVVTYEVLPKNTTDKTVKWESSNPEIATVDNNGKIKAIKEGKTIITASTVNNIVKTVEVNVSPKKVTGISLDKENVTLDVDDTVKLNASIYPIDAKNQDVKWESENINIANVDENGVVTAQNSGNTKVKAVSKENGNIIAVCSINVNKVKTESVTLNKTNVQLNKLTDVVYLTGEVYPSNADDKTIQWSSSNTKVAKVENGKITPVADGSAVIKAETKDGKIAYCNVKVNLPKKKITVGKVNSLKIKSGKKSATITISKASNAKYYEIYRSTNKSTGFKKVATVKSTKYVNKKLTSKKTYYYKVRAVNGSTKGSFSKVYKVKVK